MDRFKKPEGKDLVKLLTPEQYRVTQQCGTERPFENEFWDNKEPGIYVDVVTGEPLFSSLDKFDSGTGWPSFTRPLVSEHVVERTEKNDPWGRTEVRSARGDSHLGHVFPDGPRPTGLRYCINSASLRFIPAARLKDEGYGEFTSLFDPLSGPRSESKASGTKRSGRTAETATFAGGCFWGMEEIIRKIPGVIETVVGYSGGIVENPTYEQVSRGDTGHAESVQIIFDPKQVSYEDLLRYFFRMHDPTTFNRQGNDLGSQYRSVIFYHSEEQCRAAEKIRSEVDRSGRWKRKVVTEITPAGPFYPAEDYHQKYLEKNPGGYTCHYLRD